MSALRIVELFLYYIWLLRAMIHLVNRGAWCWLPFVNNAMQFSHDATHVDSTLVSLLNQLLAAVIGTALPICYCHRAPSCVLLTIRVAVFG